MAKFAKYLPKEDLKKFGKEVGKVLVASDFKHKRVEDPTRITDKQEQKVKKFVRGYFEKVLAKRKDLDQKKKEKLAANESSNPEPNGTAALAPHTHKSPTAEIDDDDVFTPDSPPPPVEDSPSIPPVTPLESPDTSRKRTRDEVDTPDDESNKRQKEGEVESVPTPPPPPPPPTGDMDISPLPPALDIDDTVPESREETDEERELRLQEEELMRENDEAAAAMEGVDGDLEMVMGMKEQKIDVDREMELRNKAAFERNEDVTGVFTNGDGGVVNGGVVDTQEIFRRDMQQGDEMEGLEEGKGNANGSTTNGEANGNGKVGHEREEVMSH
jgi:hypothetical protein